AQAAVVGNSMGGLIAAELALAEPDRVSRLALISPAGVPIAWVRDRMWALRLASPLAELAMAWVGEHAEELVRRPRLRRGLIGTVACRPDEVPATFVAEQVRGMGKPAFWPALEALAGHSVGERLHGISCPTLLIWGRNDRVLSVRSSDVFANAIGGVRKVIYPDTGHCSMFERADDVNRLLAELFGDAPPPVGREPDERPAAEERRVSV
ncbi:MAG: alpha/beta fold hydrolase, partial [Solirubrobacteraceae bacterium]